MDTLNSPQVQAVLARLRAEEADEQADLIQAGRVMAMRVRAQPGRGRYDLPISELVDLFSGLGIPVSNDTGQLLYIMARFGRATGVVEFGTSFGISTIYLAAAVRDNGGGWVVGTEMHAGKAELAQANLRAAGLDDLTEIRGGDARESLRRLPGPVDLLLIDGFPSLHLDILRRMEPWLRPGALVVADAVPGGRDILRPYRDYVGDPGNGYATINIPLGDTLDVSIRTR
jgi:predicted O-methyltransferase YrrM